MKHNLNQARSARLLSPAIMLGFLALLLTISNIQAAASKHVRFIEDAAATINEKNSQLTIKLGAPIRLINQSPRQEGDTLTIRLSTLTKPSSIRDPSLREAVEGRESLSWQTERALPLQEISYDGSDDGNATLTLRFQRQVQFSISATRDKRGVIVNIRPTTAKNNAFVLNLESSQQRIAVPSSLPGHDINYLYSVRFKSSKDGKIWNRLRLGFYPSLETARRALSDIKSQYPKAWISKASPKEQSMAVSRYSRINKSTARRSANVPTGNISSAEKKTTIAPSSSRAKLSKEESERIMQAARKAMTGKDYGRAIALLTHLIQEGDRSQHQDSRELLGLAYERKGQFAHAKAEYEEYLRQYPKGDGTVRVQQRLSGLMTAQIQEPKEELRGSNKRKDREPEWRLFSSLSQYYSEGSQDVSDANGSQVTQSDLNTYFSFNADRRGGRFDISTEVNADNRTSFLSDAGTTADRTRLRSLYAEVVDNNLQLSGRIGRQRLSKYGVLGRFDGLLAGYSVTTKLRSNLVYGFPVNTNSYEDIDTDNPFYGVSVEYGPFRENWDMNAYFINQDYFNLTDRQAVGGELRYLDQNRSLFTLLDYDTFHNNLNTLLMLGNWNFEGKGRTYFSYSQLKSPTLLTQNAIGMQDPNDLTGATQLFTLDEMYAAGLTDAQIYQAARDKTETSSNLTLGWARPINETYQYDNSLNVASLTGVSGQDISYNLQFIASNLMTQGDSTILGLRLQTSDSTDVALISGKLRYPVGNWRFNPLLILQQRTNKGSNSDKSVVTTSLRTDYRLKRNITFEGELRADFATETLSDNSSVDSKDYYLNIGYRWDFSN